MSSRSQALLTADRPGGQAGAMVDARWERRPLGDKPVSEETGPATVLRSFLGWRHGEWDLAPGVLTLRDSTNENEQEATTRRAETCVVQA